jgi:hypothetical protein
MDTRNSSRWLAPSVAVFVAALAVLLFGFGPGSGGGSTPAASAPVPEYLPAGYQETYAGPASESAFPTPAGQVRVFGKSGDDPVLLVVRALDEGAAVAGQGAGGPERVTVRGQAGELVGTERGGMALTWTEGGRGYAVSFEPPENAVVDFAPRETADELVRVADGLRL